MNRQLVRQNKRRRNATATAELAICLPLLTILMLGTIEACQIIAKRQVLCRAAHQVCRVAAQFDSTTDQVRNECSRYLETQNLSGAYAVRTEPSEIVTANAGEPVTVDITFDASSHCFILDSTRDTYEIKASFTVLRQHPPPPISFKTGSSFAPSSFWDQSDRDR